jgi:hypothetical protein
VPKGIEVFEIHPDAARNHFRRSLFIHLGAKTFSKDLVCDTIVQMHEHPQFNPRNQSNEDMIAHMMFLYRANWKNLGNHDLWLVTEFGSARRGSDIYLDSEELHSATTLLKEHRKEYPFLHEDYFQAFSCTDLDWTAWLVKNLRLAKYPRLVVPSTDPESILSKDFQLLLSTCSSQQILLLLRDNWDYYSTWIGPDNSLTMEASRTKLTEKLSSIQVTCCGGREAPLNQTIIPMGDMVHESIIEMFLLDIPEPEDTRWKCLRHLGVVVESGAGPFIQCLQRLKVSGASLKQVSELYTQIQRHAVRHGETIR